MARTAADLFLRSLIVAIFMIFALLGSTAAVCAEDAAADGSAGALTDIRIALDGKEIVTDTPPMIISERTLVPVRAVFEAMGGTAEWNNDTRQVTIHLNGHVIGLVIDSPTAQVNAAAVQMDVPAMIINDRTMVPVRFIAESAGSAVDWDNDARTVLITSPALPGGQARITAIGLKEADGAYIVEVSSDRAIDDYDDFMLKSPERFVLDVQNAALQYTDGPIPIDNGTIRTIRFSQFDTEAVRVVVDLNERTRGKVSRSADKRTLYIAFNKEGESNDDGEDENEDSDGQSGERVLPELDAAAEDILVFIDAGHGGADTGAIGFLNGKTVLYEKDANLDVALRLEALLVDAGVRTRMLRTDDRTITLQERPAAANAIGADLYISIHHNSSENLLARGVEVLYCNKASDEAFGISGESIAGIIQEAMLEELGIPDRTIKERPALAVLNKTTMPSIIIEGAFMSNEEDLRLILTDGFREGYAYAAACAIIQVLNESVEN